MIGAAISDRTGTRGAGTDRMTTQAQIDAARHAYERVCFTRYLNDVLRGEKTVDDLVTFMAAAMHSFDSIVAKADEGNGPDIYAEKRALVHDYPAEVEAERRKLHAR